jgi:uncharacterized protein (UPF0332 family)
LNEASIEQLIQYRPNQSEESLLEAETLMQSSLWRGAINRAYYAMFYAVLALAVYKQEVTSKHTGVIAFFDKDFVKTGIFTKDLSRSLHLAFERRQNNDYGEVFTVSEDEANQSLKDARFFVKALEEYVTSLIK